MTEPSSPTTDQPSTAQPSTPQPHEDIDEIVTTDPGPKQDPGQGEDTPAQEAPEGEPGFS